MSTNSGEIARTDGVSRPRPVTLADLDRSLESKKAALLKRIASLVFSSLLALPLFLGNDKVVLGTGVSLWAFTVLINSDWSKKRRAWIDLGLVITEIVTTFCWPLMGLGIISIDMSYRIIEKQFKDGALLDKIFAVVSTTACSSFVFSMVLDFTPLFVLSFLCSAGAMLIGFVEEFYKGHVFESFIFAGFFYGFTVLGMQVLGALLVHEPSMLSTT